LDCVLIVTSRNSLANSHLSSPTDLSEKANRDPACTTIRQSNSPIKIFVLLSPRILFFEKDFSENQYPSHWQTITCQADPSDFGAFTRHCLWVGSSPQAKARG
jgi:hypothetical protein